MGHVFVVLIINTSNSEKKGEIGVVDSIRKNGTTIYQFLCFVVVTVYLNAVRTKAVTASSKVSSFSTS